MRRAQATTKRSRSAVASNQDLSASRQHRLTLGLGIALAAVTLLVYCRCFDFGFIQFDDPVYVFENRHVLAGLTADSVRWAFTTFDCANWHPLTWLSLQCDALLYGGPKAGGFHATNVVLHIANVVLLFLVLGRMTGMVWRSALVAALFALHPLHVESVAWVSERKDVLSTLFWMLTMAAYLAYVGRPSMTRYLLVALALTLGLLAKPMLITLPFVLLLLDYWPLGRWQHGPKPAISSPDSSKDRPQSLALSRLLGEKIPLFAVVLGSCVVTFLAQHQGRAVGTFEKYPLTVRVWNALLAYVTYLGEMFLPRNLAVYYPHPGFQVSALQGLAAGILLLAISWLVLWPGRRYPYLAVGWLWYLGTLVPVVGLVQVGGQAMADRYTYVPLIGCFLMLTWGGADLALAKGWSPLAPFVSAAVVLCACCALTWAQLGYWHDDLALWAHTVAITQNNALAHSRLGEGFRYRGLLEKAEAQYRESIAIDPNFVPPYVGLSQLLTQANRPEEALPVCRKAVDLQPDSALVHYNLANALFHGGFLEEAQSEFRQALVLDSQLALAHFGLGAVLRIVGQSNEALEEFRQAITFYPDYFNAQNALGETMLEQGLFNEAEMNARRALEMIPVNHPQHAALAILQRSFPHLRDLEAKLPGMLAAKADPANLYDQLDWAWFCQLPSFHHYAAGARYYAKAFATEPTLLSDPRNSHLHRAARAAAKAGNGADESDGPSNEAERSRLRGLALDWLRHELSFWSKQAQSAAITDRRAARRTLNQWRLENDLANVRDPAALAKLPESERQAWQAFWQEVARTLDEPPLGDHLPSQ